MQKLSLKAQAIKDALFATKPEPKCSARAMHRVIQGYNWKAKDDPRSMQAEAREGR